ncbi:hypothetical protein EUZ85_15505 [Hahella sp. KA22]|uniref:hypothetical protein n=1 Tax=Hahella sp. KA22 TaxID=1628392 RepID=UPI000FDDCF0F|nr:hypothetical protein [Hahella sp. KA22]AZZ92054.1 hypothetical protein ENC22_12940 [Hahella sp. KA22]QAY55425.1 hypothetical protein EUZ85_15505 [Hahella sp. KA22]
MTYTLDKATHCAQEKVLNDISDIKWVLERFSYSQKANTFPQNWVFDRKINSYLISIPFPLYTGIKSYLFFFNSKAYILERRNFLSTFNFKEGHLPESEYISEIIYHAKAAISVYGQFGDGTITYAITPSFKEEILVTTRH